MIHKENTNDITTVAVPLYLIDKTLISALDITQGTYANINLCI